jgi:hypothetical protein
MVTGSPRTIWTFLAVTLAWTAAIFLPMVVLERLSDPVDLAQYARWLARASQRPAEWTHQPGRGGSYWKRPRQRPPWRSWRSS